MNPHEQTRASATSRRSTGAMETPFSSRSGCWHGEEPKGRRSPLTKTDYARERLTFGCIADSGSIPDGSTESPDSWWSPPRRALGRHAPGALRLFSPADRTAGSLGELLTAFLIRPNLVTRAHPPEHGLQALVVLSAILEAAEQALPNLLVHSSRFEGHRAGLATWRRNRGELSV